MPPLRRKEDPAIVITQAGLLAWLLPGLGHFYLKQRGFGWVYCIAISFCYWAGMLIGGVKGSVDPKGNAWLFAAELGVGGYTGVCLLISSSIKTPGPKEPSPYMSYYPEADVAQIFLAVAGLLNVLAILDAMTRAQTGGLPVFYFEQSAQRQREAEASTGLPPGDGTAGSTNTGTSAATGGGASA